MAFTRISIGLFIVGTCLANLDDRGDRLYDPDRRDLCEFNEENQHNVVDLIFCMEELANEALDDKFKGREKTNVQEASPRIGYNDYNSVPSYAPVGSPYQDYYGTGYQFPTSSSGGFNILQPSMNLFKALYAIARYDDYKCIPRVLCEIASGRYPGRNPNGQPYSFGDIGKNALFGILSALDISGVSPILNFGKAVVLGYMNRGRTETCYDEYSKCPRNSNDLVHYLNTYNGGFFRFFGGYRPNQNPSIYRQAAMRTDPTPPPYDSSKEYAGGWKFEDDNPSSRQRYEDEPNIVSNRRQNSTGFRFPEEDKFIIPSSIKRVSKSATNFHRVSNHENGSPLLFSQEKDDDLRINYRGEGKAELRNGIRFLDNSNSHITFPDDRKEPVNTPSPTQPSDNHSRITRRSPRRYQFFNFASYEVMNLVEMFPFSGNNLQLTHPCTAVCRDFYRQPVKFNQDVENGKLITEMIAHQPIFDMSGVLPCEVTCIDGIGRRKKQKSALHKILKVDSHPPNVDVHQGRLNESLFDGLSEINIPLADMYYSGHQTTLFDELDEISESLNETDSSSSKEGTTEKPYYRLPPDKDRTMTGQKVSKEPYMTYNLGYPTLTIPIGQKRSKSKQGGRPFSRRPHPSALHGLPKYSAWLKRPCHEDVICPPKLRFLIMCRQIIYAIVLQFRATPLCNNGTDEETENINEIQSTTIASVPSTMVPNFETTINLDNSTSPMPKLETLHTLEELPERDPGGIDYPRVSCLETEKWKFEESDCLPMKFEVDTDYIQSPGAGIETKLIRKPHKLRKKNKKKITVVYRNHNITYL